LVLDDYTDKCWSFFVKQKSDFTGASGKLDKETQVRKEIYYTTYSEESSL
jgi:hypothetical protein